MRRYIDRPPVPVNNMGLKNERVIRKMGNVPCDGEYEGKGTIRFRSKLERYIADYLDILRRGGHIKDWEYEKTTFTFPDAGAAGGVTRWLIDFDVVENDGKIYHIEAKGRKLASDNRKLRLLRQYVPDTRIMYVCGSHKLEKAMKVRWGNVLWRIISITGLTRGAI